MRRRTWEAAWRAHLQVPEAELAAEQLVLLPHVLLQVPEEAEGRPLGTAGALVLQQLPGETPGQPPRTLSATGPREHRTAHPRHPGSERQEGRRPDRCVRQCRAWAPSPGDGPPPGRRGLPPRRPHPSWGFSSTGEEPDSHQLRCTSQKPGVPPPHPPFQESPLTGTSRQAPREARSTGGVRCVRLSRRRAPADPQEPGREVHSHL